RDASGKPVAAGRLEGRYAVRFVNGNTLPIESKGELTLARQNNVPVITGRLGMNDYVARVVEREGELAEPQAARALAVAARSYLV
ncbi:SpoIID/LytB domain-containing protein, partial [Klebsiella variicola]|nr:SpoIID/LytB domain-containing protein [Klebsiella variicola]